MAPCISPFQDAIQHVISQTDKICKLEVQYINAVKGCGVFAKGTICKGDFVVQYRGDMISDAESQRRRKLYHPSCAAFMFAFKWRGKTWCVDASREDGSIGRLVNDEHRRPNSKMKKMYVNGVPHLCVFALDDIKEGEEITYDYGGEDCPWRTQTTSITVDTMEEDDSDPVHSESLIDGAFAPKTTPEETTSITVDTMEEDDSDPVHSESLIDGAFAPKTTPEEITEFENETETFVPKLRRTKSILMKDTDLEDSELFDSSSESADDYVPGTKSDSDPDSSIGPPVCDSTTPDNMILDSHNITPEAPRAVEEPCSSQTINDSVVVSSFKKKGSKEKKRHLDYIGNRGNFAHNAAVMEYGKGKLVPRPPKGLDEIGIDPNEPHTEETFPHTERDEMLPQPPKRQNPHSSSDEVPSESCRMRPSSIAPPAEESLPPTERNEMQPQPPNKPKPVSTMRPSSKGTTAQKKKTPWKQTEVEAVESHMNRFITSCIVPAKFDCEKCIRAEPEALNDRSWQNVKFYIYNRITANKRKFS